MPNLANEVDNSPNRPVPIGLRIANAMHKLGVYGLPRNYEIFYDALTGTNEKLNSKFWALGRAPNQEMLDELYKEFYGSNEEHEVVEKARHVLESHLGDAIKLLKAEQSSMTAYGRVLDKTASSVQGDNEMSPLMFLRIVEVLANATGSTLKEGRKALDAMVDKTAELDSLKQELAEYKRLVDTDPLTGVWNRRAFDNRLTNVGTKNSGLVSLLLLDIDHFKQINDRWGHPFGDVIIRDTAQIVQSKLRNDVFVARTGGEEFAVILDGVEAELSEKLAERLVQSIREASFSNDDLRLDKGNVTISAGVCTAPPAVSGEDLYSKADQALYQSKRNGRNRVTMYRDQQSDPSVKRKDYYLYRA